jgi:hypothetical protein
MSTECPHLALRLVRGHTHRLVATGGGANINGRPIIAGSDANAHKRNHRQPTKANVLTSTRPPLEILFQQRAK